MRFRRLSVGAAGLDSLCFRKRPGEHDAAAAGQHILAAVEFVGDGRTRMCEPEPACHSVLPSLESSASKLPYASPVKVRPESVVSTPAPSHSGPSSWLQRILPVW